jgi:hypothetical protein
MHKFMKWLFVFVVGAFIAFDAISVGIKLVEPGVTLPPNGTYPLHSLKGNGATIWGKASWDVGYYVGEDQVRGVKLPGNTPVVQAEVNKMAVDEGRVVIYTNGRSFTAADFSGGAIHLTVATVIALFGVMSIAIVKNCWREAG